MKLNRSLRKSRHTAARKGFKVEKTGMIHLDSRDPERIEHGRRLRPGPMSPENRFLKNNDFSGIVRAEIEFASDAGIEG